ncbi:uncharacterized protein [Palaemon carinicauda]|uniref:uncharacterized protein n=1 Tax=Palaemon carinicauda TaxID=392227 RepID=UPI0035B5B272
MPEDRPPQELLHGSRDLWSLQQQAAPYRVLHCQAEGWIPHHHPLPELQRPRRTQQPQTNHTPPPTNRASQRNPNPSRHAIPELPSPPSLPPAPKPQRPPRPPPKSKRSPSRTPSTPSPLRFISPSNPSAAQQPKRPPSSSSAPVTHTPSSSHSLREFPSLPNPTVRSQPSASHLAKPPPTINSNA